MTITFYNFTGREDLVDKTGSLGTAHAYTGTLRDGCSLMDPVIDMEFSGTFGYNYAYITEFARWYFVTGRDVIATNLWRVSMHEDVLMTWKGSKTSPKTGIYGSYGYVTRSYLPSFNGTIVDGKFPQKANSVVTFIRPSTTSWKSSDTFLSNADPVGERHANYVLFFNGYGSSGGSAVQNIFPTGAAAIGNSAIRVFSDAFNQVTSTLTGKIFYDYVSGFYWYPFQTTSSTSSANQYGELDSPGVIPAALVVPAYTAYRADIVRDVTTWSLIVAPPGTVGKQFLCYSPYTKYTLRFLPFGSFDLDPGYIWQENTISGNKTIYIKAITDVISSQSCLFYSVDNSNWIYLGSAQVGMKVPLVGASTNVVGILGSVAAGAIGAVSGSPTIATAAAASALHEFAPNTISRSGTYNYTEDRPTLIVTTNAPKDTGEPVYGFSDGEYLEIGSISSGFHVIDTAALSGSYFQTADLTEINEIKEKLKKGVVL